MLNDGGGGVPTLYSGIGPSQLLSDYGERCMLL